jgi:membrane-associated phospholipid phosphatase
LKKLVLIFFLICSPITYSSSFAQQNEASSNDPKTEEYSFIEKIDITIFREINKKRNSFLDRTIPVIDRTLLPTAVVTPPLMFFLARSSNSNYDENSAVLLGLSQATSFAATMGLKLAFQRERPFVCLDDVYCDEASTLGDPHSFPSGHTAMSFSMATSLALRYPDEPLLIAGMFTYASTIAFGRMYLGTHFPSDVAVGMLVGSGSAILMYSLRKEIFNAKNHLFGENKADSQEKGVNTAALFGGIVAADLLNYFISKSSSKTIRSSSFSTSQNGFSFQYNF